MALHGHQHYVQQGLAADRLAAPTFDQLYYATDTGQLSIYDTVGAAWSNVVDGPISNPVTIGQGGTGQTTQTAAFNALSPTTTKGDIIVDDGTDAVRQGVGSDGALVIADSTDAQGLIWARRPHSHTIYAGFQTAAAWVYPIGTGDPFGGATQFNLHKLDFTYYREARLFVRAAGSALNTTSTDVIAYDLTNAVSITPDLNFPNDGAYYNSVTAWTSLNSATYAGTANFEIQIGTNGAGAELIRVGTIILELR